MTGAPAATSNVDASSAVGLTVYLTTEGERVATELFTKHDGFQQYREALSLGSDKKPASLRLTEGMFYTDLGCCIFYGKSTMHNGRFVTLRDRFNLGYAYVVRIVCDNGDVWQNRHYTEPWMQIECDNGES